MKDKVTWVTRDLELRGHVIDVEEYEDDEPTLHIEFFEMRRSEPGARWSKLTPTQKIWVDSNEV